jgi:hypothetical protein
MPDNLPPNFSIRTGTIRLNDLGYLLCADDGGSASEVPHTVVFEWDRGNFIGKALDWSAISACIAKTPKEQLIAIGAQGEVYGCGQGEEFEENIYGGSIYSDKSGSLREVREIAGKAYAIGMDRQVYRRDGRNNWSRFDNGLPSGGKNVVGLESVDGFSSNDIYAVGWDGELWHFSGNRWGQIVSPTNLLLTRVLCAEDGNVYACGQAGLILRGRSSIWEVIEQDEVDDYIWDIEWFQGQLYLSTDQFLYHLVDDSLILVDFGEAEIPNTCYHLSTADGLLWSIGFKDLMAFDGKEWFRIAG